jgi:hypothetical protein
MVACLVCAPTQALADATPPRAREERQRLLEQAAQAQAAAETHSTRLQRLQAALDLLVRVAHKCCL